MEVILSGDAGAERDDVVAAELDDSPAAAADHVVVRVFAVAEFIVGLFDVEADLFEDAAVDQKGKCAVDGGLGNVLVSSTEGEEQSLRFEVVANLQDGLEDATPGRSEFDSVGLEVTLEFLLSGGAAVVVFDLGHRRIRWMIPYGSSVYHSMVVDCGGKCCVGAVAWRRAEGVFCTLRLAGVQGANERVAPGGDLTA